MAHLNVDYQLLFAWAPQAEALYATESIRTSVAKATAQVALAGQQAALEREQAAVLKAEDARKLAKRRGWLAAGVGVVAAILGGSVIGVAVVK